MLGVLIISGYNYRGIVAFCRFCKLNKIPFFIVAASPQDLILISDYKQNVIEIRDSSKLTANEFSLYKKKIINLHLLSGLLILPSSEYLNRFLLTEKKALEAEGYILPLCSLELYKLISDKYSFGELCRKHNINVPAEYQNIESASIPFVAKPKYYFLNKNTVNEKPSLITNEKEYNELKTINHDGFYYQEFIKGNSYYLLYYLSKDGTHSVYSQENLIQQHNGLSIVAARSSEVHEQVSSEYTSLLLEIGFTGLIMIELRSFKNKFYMIEANPRLWGPSQLILDAGMDLFYRFAIDYKLISDLPQTIYEAGKKYFWTGGIIEDQKKKCPSSFYNYEKAAFFEEYAEWCNADVYMRPDTNDIFFHELAGD